MKDASSLAREWTEQAIQTLADIMQNPYTEDRDRIRAGEVLLDRGNGKAITAIIALPSTTKRAQSRLLAALSDEELEELSLQQRAPVLIEQQPRDPMLD